MSINYKLMNDPIKGVLVGIKKTDEDGSISFIPYCPDNTDYQDYLAWVAEGNTADPAD